MGCCPSWRSPGPETDGSSRASCRADGGVAPPPRQLMIITLGGLREPIATTVEDGGDITEVAVQATQAMLGPYRLPAPAR